MIIQSTKAWSVYLIECVGGSIYTGISNDVAARYKAHLAGKGARYTRANRPVRLLCSIECASRREAAQTEYATKKLTAAKKRELATSGTSWQHERHL